MSTYSREEQLTNLSITSTVLGNINKNFENALLELQKVTNQQNYALIQAQQQTQQAQPTPQPQQSTQQPQQQTQQAQPTPQPQQVRLKEVLYNYTIQFDGQTHSSDDFDKIMEFFNGAKKN